jgi:tetratricopeptide (TPR) repeat protein
MNDSRPDAQAFAHFRAGRLADAEREYRTLVARDPGNAAWVHLLGFIVARTGRRDEGLAILDRSIALEPGNPGFLDNRGQVLLQAGRDEEARADFAAAVAAAPTLAPAWLHLSQALRRLRRTGEARAAIARARALGDNNTLRYHAGLLALEAREWAEAEREFRQVLETERSVPAMVNLGVVLRETGRDPEAMACFQRAAATDPANPEALNNLGLALHQDGQTKDAIRLFKRALQLRPGFAQALVNWGNALRDDGDLAGAAARFDEAAQADPASVEALNNAASVALESGELDAARERYERALALRPDYPESRAGMAQVRLREQDYAAGWHLYEARFDTRPPHATRRPMPIPPLDASNLDRAKRVAVWMEQGIGDQILFSTLLPEFRKRGIEVVAEVDARLLGLYRRGMPDLHFVTPAESGAAFASCDAQVALGSLPRLFRRDVASFASQPRAVMAADPQRVAAMRKAIGEGPAIAISWRSLQKGNRKALGERKSIPLEAFAALAERTGALLVDVQYGDVADERAEFERRHTGVLLRIPGLDPFDDLEGVAAALVACGRLVASSNVAAHLAGALGVPTDLLYLRGWPPFFYWIAASGGRSPWYPSVRVPADPAPDWDAAFAGLGGGQA